MVRKLGQSGSDSAFTLDMPTSDYSETITQPAIEVQPDETKATIHVTPDEGALWHETGTNDETYTSYNYIRDGQPLFDSPALSPLGIYDNLYRFSQPIVINEDFKVEVSRSKDAPGVAKYFSKVRYVPIPTGLANRLETILNSL